MASPARSQQKRIRNGPTSLDRIKPETRSSSEGSGRGKAQEAGRHKLEHKKIIAWNNALQLLASWRLEIRQAGRVKISIVAGP